jgi:hypothetical protein
LANHFLLGLIELFRPERQALTEMCEPIEAEVTTDQGSFSFAFTP